MKKKGRSKGKEYPKDESVRRYERESESYAPAAGDKRLKEREK